MKGSDQQSGRVSGPVVSAPTHARDTISTAATALLVNRTHRIVRERAQRLKSQRSLGRSLWIPMAVSAAFLVILCTAIWSLLDQYDIAPTGIPDASSQIFIFLLWFFPASAAILALAWAHRAHADRESIE